MSKNLGRFTRRRRPPAECFCNIAPTSCAIQKIEMKTHCQSTWPNFWNVSKKLVKPWHTNPIVSSDVVLNLSLCVVCNRGQASGHHSLCWQALKRGAILGKMQSWTHPFGTLKPDGFMKRWRALEASDRILWSLGLGESLQFHPKHATR